MSNTNTQAAAPTTQVLRFGNYDSRTGDHEYSGWYTGYSLCDGTRHVSIHVPDGVWCDREATWEEAGQCDKKSCVGGKPVEPEKLSSVAQEALHIKVRVPEGCVLAFQGSAPFLQHSVYFPKVFCAGQEVTPKQLQKGKLLKEGESDEFTSTCHNTKGAEWSVTVKVTCRGGKAETAEAESEAQDRKDFAKAQIEWLKGLGYTQDQAYSVMRAAGPGQVQQAVEWAKAALQKYSDQEAAREAVLTVFKGGDRRAASKAQAFFGLHHLYGDAGQCLCYGTGGKHGFGKSRMASVLQELGLPDPDCSSSHTFFGVLAGARAVLEIGLPK